MGSVATSAGGSPRSSATGATRALVRVTVGDATKANTALLTKS